MGLILALAGALQDSCRAQGTTEQRRCGQTSILGALGLPQCRHTAPAAWPIGFHCICGLVTHTFCTALVSSCEPGKNICFQKKNKSFHRSREEETEERPTLCAHSLPHSSNLLFLSQYTPLLHASLSFNHPLPSWVTPLPFFPSHSCVCSIPGWEHWFGRGTDMRQH